MAEVKGMLCICDRCGATTFRKTTGDEVTDGGFTRWNCFEDYPAGWKYVHLPKARKGGGDIALCCTVCSELWDSLLIEKFMNGTDLVGTEVR
jgi:hypothetical protein